jgi:hypothetical protein
MIFSYTCNAFTVAKDKQKHFSVGFAINLVTFSLDLKSENRYKIALITAVSKEIYDNNCGGTSEIEDILFTMAGFYIAERVINYAVSME